MSLPFSDEILAIYRADIGRDFEGYRNHDQRVSHFSLLLSADRNSDGGVREEKVVVVACFRDLAFGPMTPSITTIPALAGTDLRERELAGRSQEVGLMIRMHHEVRAYEDAHHRMVEAIRKEDLIDVSPGLVRFGLPTAGFHRTLLRLFDREFLRNPLNPMPMMRW